MVAFSEISVLILTVGSTIIGVISQIQHSRCSEISLCGSLVNCIREVPPMETVDIPNQPHEN